MKDVWRLQFKKTQILNNISLALDFRTFLENMKMSSSISKILETGINVFKINYQIIKNKKNITKYFALGIINLQNLK